VVGCGGDEVDGAKSVNTPGAEVYCHPSRHGSRRCRHRDGGLFGYDGEDDNVADSVCGNGSRDVAAILHRPTKIIWGLITAVRAPEPAKAGAGAYFCLSVAVSVPAPASATGIAAVRYMAAVSAPEPARAAGMASIGDMAATSSAPLPAKADDALTGANALIVALSVPAMSSYLSISIVVVR
jgi:hypothetical protein